MKKLNENQRRLVCDNLNLIEYCSKIMFKKLPNHIDINELNSSAQLGLVLAAQKYDSKICDNFEPYAKTVIFGSIIDNLRTLSWGNKKQIVNFEVIDFDIVDKHKFSNYESFIPSIISKYDKEILDQYFIQGLSLNEISLKFSIHRSKVNRIIKKCLSLIKQYLEQ